MSADTRTVSFLALLRSVAQRCGLDPDAVGTVEGAALAEHLTTAARKAWRHYDFPDTLRTEHRALRPLFDLTDFYSLADEVYDFDADTYFRALVDGFTGQPTDEEAFWEQIGSTPLVRSLLFANAGDIPIAEVLGAYDADPATDSCAQALGFHLSDEAIQFEPDCPNTVWLRFRLPPPRFTTAAWDAAVAYVSGDLVYLAPDCHLALDDATGAGQSPLTDPERWRIQQLPELLEDAVKDRAKSEWLSGQGQDEKALVLKGAARDALDDATSQLSETQGQTRRFAVATRTRATRAYQPRRIGVR